MVIVQSNRFFFQKKLRQYKILEKVAALLLQLDAFKKKLFKRSLSFSHEHAILPISARLLTSSYLYLFRLPENAAIPKFSFLFTRRLGIPDRKSKT